MPSSDASRESSRGGVARAIGDVLPSTLRGMGVPSRAQAQRVRTAWAGVADPAWADRTEPVSLSHGTLFVAVDSASLRDQLAQFEVKRLLDAVGRALPMERVVALRFVAAEGGAR
jgi:predicted nucleic acid-binding Zn ribbon protein